MAFYWKLWVLIENIAFLWKIRVFAETAENWQIVLESNKILTVDRKWRDLSNLRRIVNFSYFSQISTFRPSKPRFIIFRQKIYVNRGFALCSCELFSLILEAYITLVCQIESTLSILDWFDIHIIVCNLPEWVQSMSWMLD